MGRTTAANDANSTYGGQSKEAFDAQQKDIGQYRTNEATLAAGKNVGADPFKSTSYLSNVNKLQSESLNTSADSAKAAMARRSLATGGINGSQAILGQRDTGLQTGRLADTLTAGRAADDYKGNLAYQQYLAGAPLAAGQLEGGAYGTATGGQGNALTQLTNLSGQQYGFWGGLAGSAMQGAGAGFAHTCWIAEALYGVTDPRTHLLRSWLNDEFQKTWFGRQVMKLYRRFGERVARGIRRFKPLGWIFRPFFELALMKAYRDRRPLSKEAF